MSPHLSIGYELFTANDVPKRDPTEWQMYRKPIGSGDWQLVASQAFDPPVARHTSYGVFSLDGLESSHCDPSHRIASSPPPPLPRSVTSGSASRHIEPPRVHHVDAISVSDLESVPTQHRQVRCRSTAQPLRDSNACSCRRSHVVGMSTLSKAVLLAFLRNMLQTFAVGAALHSIIVFDVGTILMIPHLVAMVAVARGRSRHDARLHTGECCPTCSPLSALACSSLYCLFRSRYRGAKHAAWFPSVGQHYLRAFTSSQLA